MLFRIRFAVVVDNVLIARQHVRARYVLAVDCGHHIVRGNLEFRGRYRVGHLIAGIARIHGLQGRDRFLLLCSADDKEGRDSQYNHHRNDNDDDFDIV